MRLILIASLLLAIMVSGNCAPGQDFDNSLRSIVKPHSFSIAQWEFKTISEGITFARESDIEDAPNKVKEYFLLVKRIENLKSEIEAITTGNEQGDSTLLEAELDLLQGQKKALEDSVERILKKQIREALAQQDIFNPLDRYITFKINFPPIGFKLEKPPHLLVVSPRDRIESMREILLKQDLSLEEMESIEAEVDELGVSSLVVGLGGLGATYPSFVSSNAGLQNTINTATEEWLHQYLAFRPLGFFYVLDLIGVSRNYEIATINETLASMASEEIGSIVYEEYYATNKNGDSETQVTTTEFDFNREMREIRKAVDQYLTQGQIELAEEFMEQKRQYLASMGYYIRKLNQAYFAFHGAYADSSTSISPIGLELKELRNQSASLKDFLNAVSEMTSRQNLIDSITPANKPDKE